MDNHEQLGQDFLMSLLLSIAEGMGEMEVAQQVLLLVRKVEQKLQCTRFSCSK